jgi:hypothetical protein
VLLFSIAPILFSLALGIVCCALELGPFYVHSKPLPTPVSDTIMLWLPNLALLIALISSWWTLTRLARAGLGVGTPIALALLFSLLAGVLVGFAWGSGVMIGYVARVSLSRDFCGVENVVSDIAVPLMLLMFIWWLRGIFLTSLWAIGGAYLGLVIWLPTRLLRGLFRRQVS